MQISSRFTIALHIFAAMDVFGKDYKITSDFLAGSIQVNSVIIRNILSQLRNAGLIKVSRGTGGAELAKAPEEITFYDIYAAVESVEDGKLFRFHKNPNPDCPVGRNIHLLLDDMLDDIQDAMEKEMKRYTVADLNGGIEDLIGAEAAENQSGVEAENQAGTENQAGAETTENQAGTKNQAGAETTENQTGTETEV